MLNPEQTQNKTQNKTPVFMQTKSKRICHEKCFWHYGNMLYLLIFNALFNLCKLVGVNVFLWVSSNIILPSDKLTMLFFRFTRPRALSNIAATLFDVSVGVWYQGILGTAQLHFLGAGSELLTAGAAVRHGVRRHWIAAQGKKEPLRERKEAKYCEKGNAFDCMWCDVVYSTGRIVYVL